MPEALGDAALDLALDLGRVDRAADVVGGDDPQDLDGAELEIDLDVGDLGGEAVGRVGAALAVAAERRARRVEVALGEEHHAVGVGLEPVELEALLAARLADQDRAVGERQRRVGAGIGQPQDLGPQLARRELGRLAGDEGLARGRGLARIGGAVGVAGHEIDRRHRHAERVGGDLAEDGVGALADVDGAAVEDQAAVAGQADAHGRGIGQGGVADAVPHAADANAVAA